VSDPLFVATGGGLLLELFDRLGGGPIGAVGVSGGNEGQDQRLCQEWFLMRPGIEPLLRMLRAISDQVINPNGDPVHGSLVTRFIREDDAAAVGELLTELGLRPYLFLDVLDQHRLAISAQRVGYQGVSTADFPVELAEDVSGALLGVRTIFRPGTRVDPGEHYAFAIMPDGRVVTSNEPIGHDSDRVNPHQLV
jgi:hypothetical protein